MYKFSQWFAIHPISELNTHKLIAFFAFIKLNKETESFVLAGTIVEINFKHGLVYTNSM